MSSIPTQHPFTLQAPRLISFNSSTIHSLCTSFNSRSIRYITLVSLSLTQKSLSLYPSQLSTLNIHQSASQRDTPFVLSFALQHEYLDMEHHYTLHLFNTHIYLIIRSIQESIELLFLSMWKLDCIRGLL